MNQFSVGLARMARTIRERMNVRDNEVFTPTDLINSKTLSSVINSFFGTNQLSQFMDQTNPLAEMTHKRRMSALGPGGLSRERAGFEVRDVHYTHYGRLCPIETPEGTNIGLISSLAIYAGVDDYGFLVTPYREVRNGRLADNVVWLRADEESEAYVAPADAKVERGKLIGENIIARHRADLEIALREALANAIAHGNGSRPGRKVFLRCYGGPRAGILIAVRDEGNGFDPDAVPDPRSVDRRQLAHGRGLLLMRELMDALEFRRGGTEVVLFRSLRR